MRVGLAIACGLALAASACSAPCAASPGDGARVPPRPDDCREVAPGGLAAALAAADVGGALCLAPGRYPGPVVVTRAVTIWGPPTAVIASSGEGTTVRLDAAGARLEGVTVDGSGGRYDMLDGAVRVGADDVTVEGVTVTGAVYGILVEKVKRARIHGNHVRGGTDPAVGLRGDTLRLWETDDSEVTDNLIEDGRDVVVWYSRGNLVAGNRIVRARYGTHFMYSHDSVVEDNRYQDVTVGVFVMYSRNVTLRRDAIVGARGAAGIAIGLKDAGSVRISDNLLVADQVGLYIDASPQQPGEAVTVSGNQLRLCRTAVVFHATGHHVAITGNDFGGDQAAARIDGNGDALDVAWDGNYFDEYAGYDLDDDGIGDVPYQLRSFADELTGRQPELGFFEGTPALALADAASHLDPLFQPRALLIDHHPAMAPVAAAAGPRPRPPARGER